MDESAAPGADMHKILEMVIAGHAIKLMNILKNKDYETLWEGTVEQDRHIEGGKMRVAYHPEFGVIPMQPDEDSEAGWVPVNSQPRLNLLIGHLARAVSKQ